MYAGQGKYDLALADLHAGLALDPKSPTLQKSLAVVEHNQRVLNKRAFLVPAHLINLELDEWVSVNPQNLRAPPNERLQPFGVRVSLPAADPLRKLLGPQWHRLHWYATTDGARCCNCRYESSPRVLARD